MSNNKNYKKLYLKYKSKSLNFKRQMGGSTNDEIKEKLYKLMNNKKFPAGTYKIHVKKLEPTKDNKLKICHHYSMFSLIDRLSTNAEDCCSLEGVYYKNAIKNGKIRDLIPECPDFIPIKATVRLYGFYPAKSDPNETFFPHSAREIGDLVWHKFNGCDFIFAIESDDDRIKNFYDYSTVRTIQVETWEVPSNVFAGGVENEQIFDITV